MKLNLQQKLMTNTYCRHLDFEVIHRRTPLEELAVVATVHYPNSLTKPNLAFPNLPNT